MVKSNGGLEPLVALIKNPENHGNKELMAAVTGALWKLSMSEDNVKCFQELELVPVLIGLLKDNSEGLDDLQFNQGKIQVLTNIVGAIGESARTHENRELIREQEGLAPIIRLIASTSPGQTTPLSSVLTTSSNSTSQACWSTWRRLSDRWRRTWSPWNRLC